MEGLPRLKDIDLEDQVARLSKEIAALRKAVTKQGSALYADSRSSAHDIYADVADRISDMLPVARKRVRSVERVVQDNPATAAAVGLVVLGLIATMIFSSRRE